MTATDHQNAPGSAPGDDDDVLGDIPSQEEQERRMAEMGAVSRGMRVIMGRLQLGPPYVPRADQMKVFWLVGVALMINHYDLGIFSLATPRFQAEFGIPDSEIGNLSAIIRMGILASIPLSVIADQVGRTKLLMITIMGTAICTGLTGFAQTTEQFIALQFLVRCFSYTEDILCFVLIAEIMDPRLRGWAIGSLAALGAAGHGLAAIVFASVGQVDGEWRSLYFIGVLPLLLIAWLRRGLQETERFAEHKATLAPTRSLREKMQPLVSLVTAYPGRLAALCAVILPFAVGMSSALGLMPKYLQDFQGYGPEDVSALFLFGGVISVAGGIMAGRMSDRYGRRTILMTAITICSAGMGVFYMYGSGWSLVAMWMGSLFAFFAADAILAALGSEMFPTSYRSVASSIRGAVAAVGGVIGLMLQSDLVAATGDFATASAIPLLLCPVAVAVAWFTIPETAQRNLEDISPEK